MFTNKKSFSDKLLSLDLAPAGRPVREGSGAPRKVLDERPPVSLKESSSPPPSDRDEASRTNDDPTREAARWHRADHEIRADQETRMSARADSDWDKLIEVRHQYQVAHQRMNRALDDLQEGVAGPEECLRAIEEEREVRRRLDERLERFVPVAASAH